MKTLAKLTLALLAAGVVTSANAAIVNVAFQIDLNDVTYSTGDIRFRPTTKWLDYDFAFSSGDTVNLTYTFANGKALRLTNTAASGIEMFAMSVFGNQAGYVTFNNVSTLLTGVTGSGLASSLSYHGNYANSPNGDLNTCCHGYNWIADNALASSTDLTFTGIQASFTQVSGGSFTNAFTEFHIYGGNVVGSVVNAPAAVPTPATLPLLGLGAAAMFARSRKSRKA
jgi:hypothetical protein